MKHNEQLKHKQLWILIVCLCASINFVAPFAPIPRISVPLSYNKPNTPLRLNQSKQQQQQQQNHHRTKCKVHARIDDLKSSKTESCSSDETDEHEEAVVSQKLSVNDGTSSEKRKITESSKQESKNSKGSFLYKLQHFFFSDPLLEDIARRRKYYVSDWTDAFATKRKTIPAILFLYFACLTPAVSFGTIATQITEDKIGVVEFILSCGVSGMLYSMLCGQPMAFIAPTGLTLAFISGLYRFCTVQNLPFFPIYTWVGLWTGFFMVLLGAKGASRLIRYCTRFTDETFSALLSLNFVSEALKSLRRNFVLAPDPNNLTMPFVSLSMALCTFWSTLNVAAFKTSKYFNERARTIIKDFGPVCIIVVASLINQLPRFKRFGVPTLNVPQKFQLSEGRGFLIPFMSIPIGQKLLCAIPALLLTSLFFMDQNISVRFANNPDKKLRKGEAYNLDMIALGLITGMLSIFGLPWMCGATVQTLNHLRAMSETKLNEEGLEEVTLVTETRFTGFVIHALIASSILALPLLRYLPIPVVSGVFLFLGRKLMTGNTFLSRIRDTFSERKFLANDHPIRMFGRKKISAYTALQLFCLAGLWVFKSTPSIAIFFPSVIGVLMFIRSIILPKFFEEAELVALGDATPK